ncbi:MAG: helix-turn-helix domain-containing protein [Candidatus Cloacimonas sp.]|nr:helix-turn-helix domain-containing protein [Candidatus Cloacimonadota bacterium]
MESTGKVLQNKRKEKGLSIEDLCKTTKIHPSVINTIENGELSDLGGAGYSKMLLTTYAKALDYSDSAIRELLEQTPIKKNTRHQQPEEILKPPTILIHKNIFFIIALVILTIILIVTVTKLYKKREVLPAPIEQRETEEQFEQPKENITTDAEAVEVVNVAQKQVEARTEVEVEPEVIEVVESEIAESKQLFIYKDYAKEYLDIKSDEAGDKDLFRKYITES